MLPLKKWPMAGVYSSDPTVTALLSFYFKILSAVPLEGLPHTLTAIGYQRAAECFPAFIYHNRIVLHRGCSLL